MSAHASQAATLRLVYVCSLAFAFALAVVGPIAVAVATWRGGR